MCQNANTFIVQTLHGTALLMHFQETVIFFYKNAWGANSVGWSDGLFGPRQVIIASGNSTNVNADILGMIGE